MPGIVAPNGGGGGGEEKERNGLYGNTNREYGIVGTRMFRARIVEHLPVTLAVEISCEGDAIAPSDPLIATVSRERRQIITNYRIRRFRTSR